MEVRSLLRPLGFFSLSTSTTTTTCCAAAAGRVAVVVVPRRHQATTSRTKRALKIAPHPSFLTGQPSRNANHIVFNPPSSKPSVYHTPFAFLPKSDPRRQANLAQQLLSPPGSVAHSVAVQKQEQARQAQQDRQDRVDQGLPPTLTADEEERVNPRYHVTREQVEEMRQLRADDPERWSVLRLAERYGCTNYFVMMCCKASPEHQARERERKEAIRARWGPIRTQAREERRKRKALLLRDEL
ncbi:hypothetical protein SLS62_008373 [Diatrype stigma]|uniref:Uncharacterized protein n=1 Tax=Diatrype stigma TaxID=117547 RepID=A0AAN9YNS2_9PEZI